MSTKVRSVGLCAACGRSHRLDKDGRLVRHGYKRPGGGSLVDVCPGTGSRPFEVSVETAERHLRWIEAKMNDAKPLARVGLMRSAEEMRRLISRWKPKAVHVFEEEVAGPRQKGGGLAEHIDHVKGSRSSRRSTHVSSTARFKKNPMYYGNGHFLVTVGGIAYGVHDARIEGRGAWPGFYSDDLRSPDGESAMFLGQTREDVAANLARLQRGEPFVFYTPPGLARGAMVLACGGAAKKIVFRKGLKLDVLKARLGTHVEVVALFPGLPGYELENFVAKTLKGKVVASGMDMRTGIRDVFVRAKVKEALEGVRKLKPKLPSVRFYFQESPPKPKKR